MNKEELKKFVCDHLDGKKDEIIGSGEKLLRMPELSYCENKTSSYVGEFFKHLPLSVKENLAITGKRGDIDTGKKGPRLAVIGELDALIVPKHPFADPVTHAAHACGHHAALNAMLFAADVLTKKEVLSHLAGSLAFIAAPSEECQNQPYIASLIQEGKLTFFGGKSQLIAEGVFDDIDIAITSHAGNSNFTPSGFNGFVMKQLVFKGKSAHAGAFPEKGVNAISMMRSAMSLIDAQRDTFRDEDHIRIHGYIPYGGEAVNVVPDHAVFTLQVRGAAAEGIEDASYKVDRCVQASSIAFGGEAEVHNIFGFMPLVPYEGLDGIHEENCRNIVDKEASFVKGVFRPSSTDMGDVSMIMPSLHGYFRGFAGTAHTEDFLAEDKIAAYVNSAKLLALDAIDLLWDDAGKAEELMKEKVPMTKEEYLEKMRGFSSVKHFS